jgi:HAD superfamily hydrolase (TIGR01490 family)
MRTVFFDLDDTLHKGNSANLFIKYMLKRGELGWMDVVKGFYYTFQYKANRIDIEQVTSNFVKRYAGVLESSLLEQSDDFFDKMVLPVIYEDARSLVDEHRRKGDQLILLTAATVYACMPVTKHLGFDHYIGTQLTVSDGKLTGHIEPPLCYGKGKVARAAAFMTALAGGGSLAEATFYTDSITDLPMLEAVGDPQVVNPDPLLAREAKRRGWPVRNFVR